MATKTVEDAGEGGAITIFEVRGDDLVCTVSVRDSDGRATDVPVPFDKEDDAVFKPLLAKLYDRALTAAGFTK